MRPVVIILVIVVLAAIAAVATGFVDFSGRPGEMPKVAVEGGRLPDVDAKMGSIDVETKKTTVEVPKVKTEKETIEVPTLDVKKAN